MPVEWNPGIKINRHTVIIIGFKEDIGDIATTICKVIIYILIVRFLNSKIKSQVC